MAIDFTIGLTPSSNGTQALFVDTSTGVTFSTVKAVRLYYSNYLDSLLPATLTAGDSMLQYKEYQKSSLLPSVYDNKTIVVGQRFIPPISGLTVLTGDTFVTTGRLAIYIPPATYLPTVNYTPLVQTPQDLLLSASTTIFPDALWSLQFETYQDTSPNPIVNLVAGATFIVTGTSGTAVFDGDTFRPGEVFVAGSANVVTFTGAATLKVIQASKFKFFMLLYSMELQIKTLIMRIRATCGCNSDLDYRVFRLKATLESLGFMDVTNRTDADLAQTTIDQIQAELVLIQECVGVL